MTMIYRALTRNEHRMGFEEFKKSMIRIAIRGKDALAGLKSAGFKRTRSMSRGASSRGLKAGEEKRAAFDVSEITGKTMQQLFSQIGLAVEETEDSKLENKAEDKATQDVVSEEEKA